MVGTREPATHCIVQKSVSLHLEHDWGAPEKPRLRLFFNSIDNMGESAHGQCVGKKSRGLIPTLRTNKIKINRNPENWPGNVYIKAMDIRTFV